MSRWAWGASLDFKFQPQSHEGHDDDEYSRREAKPLRVLRGFVVNLVPILPLDMGFIARIRILSSLCLCVFAMSLLPFPLDMGSIARNRSAAGRARCKPGMTMLDTARPAARGSGSPQILYCFVALSGGGIHGKAGAFLGGSPRHRRRRACGALRRGAVRTGRYAEGDRPRRRRSLRAQGDDRRER